MSSSVKEYTSSSTAASVVQQLQCVDIHTRIEFVLLNFVSFFCDLWKVSA